MIKTIYIYTIVIHVHHDIVKKISTSNSNLLWWFLAFVSLCWYAFDGARLGAQAMKHMSLSLWQVVVFHDAEIKQHGEPSVFLLRKKWLYIYIYVGSQHILKTTGFPYKHRFFYYINVTVGSLKMNHCWCFFVKLLRSQHLLKTAGWCLARELTARPRNETHQFTWVMTDVPIFHITQPWKVYGLLDGNNNGDI